MTLVSNEPSRARSITTYSARIVTAAPSSSGHATEALGLDSHKVTDGCAAMYSDENSDIFSSNYSALRGDA